MSIGEALHLRWCSTISALGPTSLPHEITPVAQLITSRFTCIQELCKDTPWLCPQIDLVRTSDTASIFITTKYRVTLDLLIQKHALLRSAPDREQVYLYGRGISRALSFLHSYSVFVGFLRPSMVCVDAERNVCLAEVAHSDLLVRHTFSVDDVLSFALVPFVAPEVYSYVIGASLEQPSGAVLRKSDAWALGMILAAYMLSGEMSGGVFEPEYAWATSVLPLSLQGTTYRYGNELVEAVMALIHPQPSQRISVEVFLARVGGGGPTARAFVPEHYLKCMNPAIPSSSSAQEKEKSSKGLLPSLYWQWQRLLEGLQYNDPTVAMGFKSSTRVQPAMARNIIETMHTTPLQDPLAFFVPPLWYDAARKTVTMDARITDVQRTEMLLDQHQLQALIETSKNENKSENENGSLGSSRRGWRHMEESNLCSARLDIVTLQEDITTYRALLLDLPHSRRTIIQICQQRGVLPILRGELWACILGLSNNPKTLAATYRECLERKGPTPHERQIQLDIPRCHQYHTFLSTAEGHRKLFSVLRAWEAHQEGQLTYWQGLDSVAAALLQHSIHDEPRVFGCLCAVVRLFVPNLFKAEEMSLRTSLYTKLLAYHDPELATHLEEVDYRPELYTLPWFLTLFSHVMPLSAVDHIWDALFLGPVNFIVCLAVSLIHSARDRLLRMDFNNIILYASEMLDNLDIHFVIEEAKRIVHRTPKSILDPRFTTQDASSYLISPCALLKESDLQQNVLSHPHQYSHCYLDEFLGSKKVPLCIIDVSYDVVPVRSRMGSFCAVVSVRPSHNDSDASQYANHLEEQLTMMSGAMKGHAIIIIQSQHSSKAARALIYRGWPYVSVLCR